MSRVGYAVFRRPYDRWAYKYRHGLFALTGEGYFKAVHKMSELQENEYLGAEYAIFERRSNGGYHKIT